MDYGNTKIPSMHLYPRRLNVAAQVAEELKTVTMEEHRKKEKEEPLDNDNGALKLKIRGLLVVTSS